MSDHIPDDIKKRVEEVTTLVRKSDYAALAEYLRKLIHGDDGPFI